MLKLSTGHFYELILETLPRLFNSKVLYYSVILNNLSELIATEEFHQIVAALAVMCSKDFAFSEAVWLATELWGSFPR